MSSHRSCWSCYWLMRAQALADRSTCTSRAVGAVAVVSNRYAVAEGFNGTLPGRKHCDDGGCDRCRNHQHHGLETCVCCHAEANLVSTAARMGHSLLHTTVYSTCQPCLGCTKLLVSAGVEAVVYDEDYPGAKDLQGELNEAYLNNDPNGVSFTHFHCTCS